MSIAIHEQNLLFTFEDSWQVVKLDDHRAYRSGLGKLAGSKAVDFLGIHQNQLYFIEAKDFRGHRIENQQRLRSGQLGTEIAQKVRDSVACIVAAHRQSGNSEWQPFLKILRDQRKLVKVVVWLEHDLPADPYTRNKDRASIATKEFKKKLRWLTTTVLVANMADNPLPALDVTNQPH